MCCGGIQNFCTKISKTCWLRKSKLQTFEDFFVSSFYSKIIIQYPELTCTLIILFLAGQNFIQIIICTSQTIIHQNLTIEFTPSNFSDTYFLWLSTMTGSQCSVCHVHMEKARVHYGGVSCYSCRAFFRRTTQRDELAKCKFDGKCKVDHQERKSCPPCRYDRCLR